MKSMVDQVKSVVGKVFSLNATPTGSALLLNVDEENNRVFYMECYSPYGNYTGKNVKGEPRTDALHMPTPGVFTMSIKNAYGAIYGWE